MRRIIWSFRSEAVYDILKRKTTKLPLPERGPMFKTLTDNREGILVYLMCGSAKPMLFKTMCGDYVLSASESLSHVYDTQCNKCIVGEFIYKEQNINKKKKEFTVSDFRIYDTPLRVNFTFPRYKQVRGADLITFLEKLERDGEDNDTFSGETLLEKTWRLCRKHRKVERCEDCIRYNEHCTKGHGMR